MSWGLLGGELMRRPQKDHPRSSVFHRSPEGGKLPPHGQKEKQKQKQADWHRSRPHSEAWPPDTCCCSLTAGNSGARPDVAGTGPRLQSWEDLPVIPGLWEWVWRNYRVPEWPIRIPFHSVRVDFMLGAEPRGPGPPALLHVEIRPPTCQ